MCGRIAALVAGVCVAAALPAYAADGATYWWENPEVAKSVTLAAAQQHPQSMVCDVNGNYLVLYGSGDAITAAYDANALARRKGANTVLANSFAGNFDFSGSYKIGGNSLIYSSKSDGKVYVTNGGTETALVDLAGEGSAIVVVKVALSESAPYLNVLLASGKVIVYRLAADGLALASVTPIATATTADVFADSGAPALIEVSADGRALFFTTATGDKIYVARSTDWGLVDCVAYNASASTFPWRDAKPQTPTPNSADINPLTIPPESSTFDAPFIWPWAVDTVYRKIGWSAASIVSTFANFTPGDDYQAEYHFAENYFTSVGRRVYDLMINDEVKYEGLDSYVVSGNVRQKAVALSYDTTADSAGKIVFTLAKKVDNPIYCGFAIKGREAPSALQFGSEFALDGATGTLTWGARDALAYYVQSAPSREGPWTTILRDQTAKRLAVTPGAENTVYYRVVASNGVGMVKSAVRCSKREKYTVYALNCGFDAKRYGRFAPLDYCLHAPTMEPDFRSDAIPDYAANEHALPSGVAQTELFGNRGSPIDFSFANLRPDRTYDVRFYFDETYHVAANGRVYSLKANGTTVFSGADAYAATGGKYLTAEFVATGIAPRADGTLDLSFVREKSDVLISALEIVENGGGSVPLVPIIHGVYVRKNGVQVSIGSGTGELKYDIRRRPAAGGEYETLVTGFADNVWMDVGTTEGYVYSVRAVDAAGVAGDWSGDVAIAPAGSGPQSFLGVSPQSNVSFSNLNGTYVPWTYYTPVSMSEGTGAYSHELVLDPAPDDLYARILFGSTLRFAFTNLYPSATYRVRLQAIENYYTAAGRRITSGVYANNSQIWGGFDAYREVGKGVFPIEGIVKATPGGTIGLYTTQQRDYIDVATVELFLLEGSTERGVARAVRSGSAENPAWTQGFVSTLDLSDVPEGLPATGNEFIWDTMISVPADGAYTFDVEQGSDYALWIDDDVCLEAHGGASTNATVTLALGAHHLRARYVQGTGEASVAVKWAGPGFARRSIASSSLTKSRTADLSQDKWRRAEINTAHEGDLYKIGQTADGSDIWRMTSSADGFYGTREKSHFVFREVKSREFEARVRLRNIPDRASASTLALTLRTGLTEFGGDYVRQMICGVTNPGQSTRWHVGPQGADFTVANPNITNNVRWDVKVPMWMRVRKWREGGRDLAEFSYSLDEENPTWTVSVTNELTATRPIYVGVEASPYTTERLVTYEFDHFELDVPPPPGMVIIVK